jgi:hypothetical protein
MGSPVRVKPVKLGLSKCFPVTPESGPPICALMSTRPSARRRSCARRWIGLPRGYGSLYQLLTIANVCPHEFVEAVAAAARVVGSQGPSYELTSLYSGRPRNPCGLISTSRADSGGRAQERCHSVGLCL